MITLNNSRNPFRIERGILIHRAVVCRKIELIAVGAVLIRVPADKRISVACRILRLRNRVSRGRFSFFLSIGIRMAVNHQRVYKVTGRPRRIAGGCHIMRQNCLGIHIGSAVALKRHLAILLNDRNAVNKTELVLVGYERIECRIFLGRKLRRRQICAGDRRLHITGVDARRDRRLIFQSLLRQIPAQLDRRSRTVIAAYQLVVVIRKIIIIDRAHKIAGRTEQILIGEIVAVLVGCIQQEVVILIEGYSRLFQQILQGNAHRRKCPETGHAALGRTICKGNHLIQLFRCPGSCYRLVVRGAVVAILINNDGEIAAGTGIPGPCVGKGLITVRLNRHHIGLGLQVCIIVCRSPLCSCIAEWLMAFHHIDDRIILGTVQIQVIAAEVILIPGQRNLLRRIRIFQIAGIRIRVGHRAVLCFCHIHRSQRDRCDARLILIRQTAETRIGRSGVTGLTGQCMECRSRTAVIELRCIQKIVLVIYIIGSRQCTGIIANAGDRRRVCANRRSICGKRVIRSLRQYLTARLHNNRNRTVLLHGTDGIHRAVFRKINRSVYCFHGDHAEAPVVVGTV